MTDSDLKNMTDGDDDSGYYAELPLAFVKVKS